MDLNKIAKKHNEWVEEMDWHNKASRMELLALVGSEVGEAVNEVCGENPTNNYPGELADIILRVLDMMVEEELDPEDVLISKIRKNIDKGKDENKIK